MKKLPIKRIPYYDKKLKGKEYMTLDEVYELFDGEIIITEKIDGHAEFKNTSLFIENIKYKHTIHYTKLPKEIIESKFQVFLGIMFSNKKIDRYIENEKLNPPVLFEGRISKNIISTKHRLNLFLDRFMTIKSEWSDELVEGIVVANHNKQLFGKISRFDNEKIIKHWSRDKKILNYGEQK